MFHYPGQVHVGVNIIIRIALSLLTICLMLMTAGAARPGEHGLMNMSNSPHATFNTLDIDVVVWIKGL